MPATPAIRPFHAFPDPQHFRDLKRLEDDITELAAHINAATFRLLELVPAYDEQEGWARHGLASCAHWLQWQCGTNLGAAREKVRVARALPALPKISEAFREGRLSYSKVRAMTRVATPKNEAFLLNIARHGTAAHVETVVRNYRRHQRWEVLQEENRRHAGRELSWFVDADGMWVIRGRFTPEQGALIEKALQAALDEPFDEQAGEPEAVSAETPDQPPDQTPHQTQDPVAQVLPGAAPCQGQGTRHPRDDEQQWHVELVDEPCHTDAGEAVDGVFEVDDGTGVLHKDLKAVKRHQQQHRQDPQPVQIMPPRRR